MFNLKPTNKELENILLVSLSQTDSSYASRIAKQLGLKDPIREVMAPLKYSAGEYIAQFIDEKEKIVRTKGKHVFMLGFEGPYSNPNDILKRAEQVAHTAKKNGAQKVTYISLELEYARSHVKEPGKAIQSELVAKQLSSAGVDSVITFHLHDPKIDKHYKKISRQARKIKKEFGSSPINEIKLFNILPHNIFAHYIKNYSNLIQNEGENIVVVLPDKGSVPFGKLFYESLNLKNSSLLVLSKFRTKPNSADKVFIDEHEFLKGEKSLQGKDILWIDDSVDTGGTIEKFPVWVLDNNNHGYGIPNSTTYIFSHPIFAGKSYELIQKNVSRTPELREIITTNSRPYILKDRIPDFSKYTTILNLQSLIAYSIIAHYRGINFKKEIDLINPDNFNKFGNLYNPSRFENHLLGKIN